MFFYGECNVSKNNKEIYLNLKDIFKRYKLTDKEMRYIWKNIKKIYCHEEFQKRMKDPFFHHHNITLGEHIIEDTIFTFKYCQRKNKDEEVTKRAILIAMLHDLYSVPWMMDEKKKYLINYHAFSHPIEASINAISWFPEYFQNLDDAKIIIDGILHHMYPCPVRAFSDLKWELNNIDLFNQLEDKYKEIILCSLKPCMFKNLSLRRSFFFEGRIVDRMDKIITIKKDLKGTKVISFVGTLAGVIKNSRNEV